MGPLDATVNFAKSTLSAGYAAGVTSITLIAGGGAKFPAVPFNAVWWNASNYSDPADDPTVEIVRVTAIVGDVLTVTRGQEGTADQNHNTPGITYKLIEGITSSQMQIITPAFVVTAANLVWAGPASGPPAAPSFRALSAADMVAAGPSGAIQFNNAGALDGTSYFTYDSTTGVVIGGQGLVDSRIPGLTVNVLWSGAPSSFWLTALEIQNTIDNSVDGTAPHRGNALPVFLEVPSGNPFNWNSLFASNMVMDFGGSGTLTFGHGLDLECNNNDIGTITNAWALSAQVQNAAAGHIVSGAAIYVLQPFNSGTWDKAYGCFIEDQTAATENFSWKSGAGMMEVGDSTKPAGIHVRGAGAFDVDGFGFTAQAWTEIDSEAQGYNYYLSNVVPGKAHGTGLAVLDNGDFRIDPDDENGGDLVFSIAAQQWRFERSSIQSASWISTLRNTAPGAGNLAANELGLWFDPTNGTPIFGLQGKQADGTLVVPGLTLGNKFLIDANVTLPFVMKKNTQAATAPGAGYAVLRWEAGSGAGTAKLVGYAGTSNTGVTIVDNVGAAF